MQLDQVSVHVGEMFASPPQSFGVKMVFSGARPDEQSVYLLKLLQGSSPWMVAGYLRAMAASLDKLTKHQCTADSSTGKAA